MALPRFLSFSGTENKQIVNNYFDTVELSSHVFPQDETNMNEALMYSPKMKQT